MSNPYSIAALASDALVAHLLEIVSPQECNLPSNIHQTKLASPPSPREAAPEVCYRFAVIRANDVTSSIYKPDFTGECYSGKSLDKAVVSLIENGGNYKRPGSVYEPPFAVFIVRALAEQMRRIATS